MKKIIVTVLACLAVVNVCIGAPPPDKMVKKLTETIQAHCPEAQIELSKDAFIAKNKTMMFTLHNTSKTGEIYPQTSQREGPNFKGFILRISLYDGKYEDAAAVPQTLQGPYFPTFIDAPATDNGNKHYQIHFSYGKGLDPELMKAIFEVIPKTKPQQQNEDDADKILP